jgi:CRISPR-associated protein Csm2
MTTALNRTIMVNIIADGNAVMLVNNANSFGTGLASDGLSKSQIRNVFGEVRRIEADWSSADETTGRANLRRLLLLKPRMAYQRKREPKTEPLMTTLTDGVDLVAEATTPEEQYRRFRHFVEFFEAVLAYHTANEKK